MVRTLRDPADLIAARSHELAMSAIKEMSIRSSKVPGAASLAWGLPSFRTPEPIRAAVAEALEDDPRIGMYALPAGLPELRAAAAHTHRRRTGIEVDPERRVMITAGNMEGLQTLFHAIVDPGDEVIVTDPGFVSHISQIRFNGGVPVFWKMDEANGWDLDVDALPGLLSPRTKAIVIVTPSNPTGAILSEAALRAAAGIARDSGVLIVIDDPYSHFTYDNNDRYFDLAAVPEFAENVAYLFTFSKAYAMSGWRAGYAVVPEALRDEMVKVHDLNMICTPRVSQVAALAGLENEPVHLTEFERILDRRRALRGRLRPRARPAVHAPLGTRRRLLPARRPGQRYRRGRRNRRTGRDAGLRRVGRADQGAERAVGRRRVRFPRRLARRGHRALPPERA